jgi:probable addiction module antidote protein
MSQSNSKFAIPPQKGFDPKKYRDNPAAIAEFLNSALGKDDLAELVKAIGAMMRAQNVLALSEETGLRRESLYRMFAGHRDPTLGNTMKVLASFGVEFAIQPRSWTKPKPPRPKLGRPPKAGSQV